MGDQRPQVAAQHRSLLSPAFMLACFCSFTFSVSHHLLFGILPLYVLAIGGRESEIGLVIGLTSVSSLIVRLPIGGAIDRWGTRVMLLAAAVVGFFSSFSYLFAATVVVLLALRMLHGLSISGFTSSSATLVADIAPAHRRGVAMGLYGVANNLSMAMSPALGIVIANAFGYPNLFLICTAIAFVTIVGIGFLRGPRRERPSGEHPRRLSTLYSLEVLPAAALNFSIFVTYGAVLAFVPIYALRHGVENPGLFYTVYALSLLAVRPVAGILSDRHGRAVVIAPGLFAIAAATAGLAFVSSAETLALVALVYGVGFGAASPTLLALAADKVSAQNRGAGMSTLLIGLEAGILTGSMAMGVVLEMTGYATMFLMAGAVPFVAFLAFLGMSLRRGALGKDAQEDSPPLPTLIGSNKARHLPSE